MNTGMKVVLGLVVATLSTQAFAFDFLACSAQAQKYVLPLSQKKYPCLKAKSALAVTVDYDAKGNMIKRVDVDQSGISPVYLLTMNPTNCEVISVEDPNVRASDNCLANPIPELRASEGK